MIRAIRYFIFLVISIGTTSAFTQNITGSWEGIMNDEYLQVNIIQQGNELCGYSMDVVLNDRTSRCKAYFKGRYDKETGIYTIFGHSFIQNSGNHVLMTMRLWRKENDDINQLRGMVTTRSSFADYFGFGDGDRFNIKRVSRIPKKLPGQKSVCFEEPARIPKATIKNTVPKNSDSSKTRVISKNIPPKTPVKPVVPKRNPGRNTTTTSVPNDTLKIKADAPVKMVTPGKDDKLFQEMTSRKNTEVSRLVVNVRDIVLKVYDNGIVDNDTVSIFYNGRLLKGKQRLSEKPLELKIALDEDTNLHKITMFAENLGSIPPNTAIIVVTAGAKRYELRSSASLEENAVLIFEYKPGE